MNEFLSHLRTLLDAYDEEATSVENDTVVHTIACLIALHYTILSLLEQEDQDRHALYRLDEQRRTVLFLVQSFHEEQYKVSTHTRLVQKYHIYQQIDELLRKCTPYL